MAGLVFGDTSAFVAKLLDSERRHEATNRTLRDLLRKGCRLLTTDYVFDEVVTRIRGLADHRRSVEAGEYLLTSSVITLIDVDPALRRAAWSLYRKYQDQAFSFTDCTSFAVMQKYGLREAYTLDADFVRAGFQVLPRP